MIKSFQLFTFYTIFQNKIKVFDEKNLLSLFIISLHSEKLQITYNRIDQGNVQHLVLCIIIK